MIRRRTLQAMASLIAVAMSHAEASAHSRFETSDRSPIVASAGLDFTIIIPAFIAIGSISGSRIEAGGPMQVGVLRASPIAGNSGSMSFGVVMSAVATRVEPASIAQRESFDISPSIHEEPIRQIGNVHFSVAAP